ncbi:hypothetical protein H6G80_28450 [Nostoc sp. FACHB-87]|uniref:hypothetical protein n=1 Tax=Nostocaceae TaxID=1162 RepID=UPI0016859406|nr:MULTISPECIES: hypothetical protein [Nostocaceae]MBD2457983.1 hypothetical protein [Nostoc sp. FACHB-87]MBD2479240.1 hypothetical protein [Anabaena sp. FACHB-83]
MRKRLSKLWETVDGIFGCFILALKFFAITIVISKSIVFIFPFAEVFGLWLVGTVAVVLAVSFYLTITNKS